MGQQFNGSDGAVFISAAPVAFTQLALTSTDHLVYSATDIDPKYDTWDPLTAPTVETSTDGTTWTNAVGGYSVISLLGQVVFKTAQDPTLQVRASGKYVPLTSVADATSWDLTIDTDTKDTTRYRSEWKTRTTLLKGGSAKFSRWWVDPYYSTDLMDADLILQLYIDATRGYKAVAHISSDNPKSSADDLVSEDISLDVSDVVPFP